MYLIIAQVTHLNLKVVLYSLELDCLIASKVKE